MLIVAATLDTFTPVSLAQSMHQQIAHSELVVVEGASHGAVVEKPDEVNAAVRSFLDRHLQPGEGSP
jgi:pimeloyl-ACP methyl ester carboxylesterase